jgi:uncharacterized protein YdeI (YjbR/CyaY-like superfamily)
MAQDLRVDAYIARAAPFAQPILTHLRGVIHAAVPGLDETIKWGMPHFTLGGKNLFGLAAFKEHASLIIHGEGQRKEGLGAFGRITSLGDLPPDADISVALRAAAERRTSGDRNSRTHARAEPSISMPDDLAAALSPQARGFLDGLAPSNRKEYLAWITGAMRAETRARRIAQAAEWLDEGKRLNWKYER